ncbi:MAG TPA: pilus assembly protein TadG-related protein [Acidimicrobiales bacterium]|nr:pilus assembly protein TadG-related protein [Acidimicrobiales bacterium]
MRRVTRAGGDERGAIIVLAAVLTIVLVGMAALVIDVGAVLDEKRQLQNGADAAALAVARSCARQEVCTQATADALSAPLVTANSGQNSAVVTLDKANGKVTVVASTGAGAAGVLPFKFGQILTGKQGQRVQATAVVRWGGIKATSVIPLTISKCEFDLATSNNTVFDVPVVVRFKTKAPTCTNTNGSDIPGGFGWVKDNDSNTTDCTVTPSAGGTVQDDTGVKGTPNGCQLPALLGKDISLVVYNGVAGTGAGGTYAIYGFGNFHLTGFQFASVTGGSVACASGESCIAGYFVRSTGSVGTGEYGGPNLAGNRVYLIS